MAGLVAEVAPYGATWGAEVLCSLFQKTEGLLFSSPSMRDATYLFRSIVGRIRFVETPTWIRKRIRTVVYEPASSMLVWPTAKGPLVRWYVGPTEGYTEIISAQLRVVSMGFQVMGVPTC